MQLSFRIGRARQLLGRPALFRANPRPMTVFVDEMAAFVGKNGRRLPNSTQFAGSVRSQPPESAPSIGALRRVYGAGWNASTLGTAGVEQRGRC